MLPKDKKKAHPTNGLLSWSASPSGSPITGAIVGPTSWQTVQDSFYADYEILRLVAEERDALAKAVGVELDRKLSPQGYARRVETLDTKVGLIRRDPDAIGWPLPESTRQSVPETIVRYLDDIRAKRVDHNGREIIVPGPRKPTPAWGRLCAALNEDVALWNHIDWIAETMYPKKCYERAQSDWHQDVAAEVKMKVISTIRCRAHEWYARRNEGTNWRGFIYRTLHIMKNARRGGAIFERAYRRARGMRAAGKKAEERLFHLLDKLEPSDVDVRRSWTQQSPAETAMQRELLGLLDVSIRKLDDRAKRIIEWKYCDAISNSQIARNMGVSLQRAVAIINQTLARLRNRRAA